MLDKSKVEAFTDNTRARQAIALIEDVVEKPYHLKERWIRLNGWIAVPVESPIREREAEWLFEASQSIDCYECLAVTTEDLPLEQTGYRVQMTQEGILNFAWEAAGNNYVLLPENRLFAVLYTTEDYFIVAGLHDFVKRAVGSSIPTARQMFHSFANDLLWPEDIRNRLLAVANKYESVSKITDQEYPRLIS